MSLLKSSLVNYENLFSDKAFLTWKHYLFNSKTVWLIWFSNWWMILVTWSKITLNSLLSIILSWFMTHELGPYCLKLCRPESGHLTMLSVMHWEGLWNYWRDSKGVIYWKQHHVGLVIRIIFPCGIGCPTEIGIKFVSASLVCVPVIWTGLSSWNVKLPLQLLKPQTTLYGSKIPPYNRRMWDF